jgi:gluconate 2-dehydrogenase gamma chain
MRRYHRRDLLATSAFILFGGTFARAGVIQGAPPWAPAAGAPPQRVLPGPWHFFTPAEGRTVEALVDRMIPPDPETPGGKDAGCAVFIDRQLAGPYGRSDGLYVSGPFRNGTKQQGAQSPLTPAMQYRKALAEIDTHCKAAYGGHTFANVEDGEKDKIIGALETGELKLSGVDPKVFFTTLLKNTREGFFGDPIYGGNRDMVAWKMIGFPGARYDYSDWIDRHNERYPHPPIGITGAPSWSPR